MKPIRIYNPINSNSLKKDILESKKIIKPIQNRYDIIFDTKSILDVVNKVIETLNTTTNESFDVYVRRLQSYIQTQDSSEFIYFEKSLGRDLLPTSKYSFIFMIDSVDTILFFKSIGEIKIQKDELIIFETNDFIKDSSTECNRIALIGSLTNNIEYTNVVKTKF